jgi:DNA-binding MarR family transcriptional regulator
VIVAVARSTPQPPQVGRVDAEVEPLVTALLTASRVLVAVSARSLAQVEDTVTLPQFRALVVLDTYGEINLLRLAELLGVTSSTAMRMIDRLLAVEVVTRRDNPANRREVLLGLTPTGTRIVRQVTRTRRAEIARIVDAMPAAHRATMIRALRSFATAAGEPDPRAEATEALIW